MLLSLEIKLTQTQTLTFREPLHGPPDIQDYLVVIFVVLPHISTYSTRNVIVTITKISNSNNMLY